MRNDKKQTHGHFVHVKPDKIKILLLSLMEVQTASWLVDTNANADENAHHCYCLIGQHKDQRS